MLDRRFLLAALSGLAFTATEALAATKKKKKAPAKKKASSKKSRKPAKKAAPKPPSPPPPPPVPEVTAPEVKAKLDAAFDSILRDLLVQSPMTATNLGLDKGDLAYLKSRLDDRSAASLNVNANRLRKAVQTLAAIDRDQLSAIDRIDYDAVRWDIQLQADAAQTWTFGENATPMNITFYAPTPYIVSQLSGFWNTVPDFLDGQHTINTAADAEAYIQRLDAFAKGLEQETARIVAEAQRGIVPPDFILKKAALQITNLRDTPVEQSILVTSITRRTAEKGIAGDWTALATAKVNDVVKPALTTQITALGALLGKATHNAGVRNLPNGAAYYAYCARVGTSTDLTPKDIHTIGLQKVAELSAEIDSRFRALGMAAGSNADRYKILGGDPSQLYPDSDEGRAQLLSDLNGKVDAVTAKIPQYFGVLPKTKASIRRVPIANELGQPSYYQPAALDGSRAGVYNINLHSMADNPKWSLPTLTYHEAVPGHHMQISIQQEAPLHQLRKVASYNAYVEGWALYSEELAATEMKMYDNDPYGRLGYLHDALFRAVRLVVDTGMHHLGWSREQAIRYMVDTTGDSEGGATLEIERYCAWPGQALGYMVGKITWLKLRDAMKKKQGGAFSYKTFHDTGLTAGSLPLAVLEDLYKAKGLI
ncbi:hypothetical protein ABI_26550 [Asticcacaulis biprosthecium C19]|uniref:Tat twin-arginine translocation pathway signal sequence domain protein n=1 Tax=Asticcacaulis biprosthecium C19 TaxID=715226 RepID=F4QPI2_9CAUL|nr:DUF885 family protein [Asticcacaulis biprosthecium]EGF91240.1 hypothetical protein ABI_26550 [Asticcacaulis biprosthecium C19]